MIVGETFSDGDSIIHRFDPRMKIVTVVVGTVVIGALRHPQLAGLALIFSAIGVLAAGLDPAQVFRRLAPANLPALVLTLTLPFSVAGTPVFNVAGFPASAEGLHRALEVVVKVNAALLLIVAGLATSPVFELAHAGLRIGIPRKLTTLFFFCFRYINLFVGEFRRLDTAARIRGFIPRANLHTYRTYGHMLGMLFVRSHARSERIWHAMLCRGFDGNLRLYRHFRAKKTDFALCTITLTFFTLLVVLDRL